MGKSCKQAVNKLLNIMKNCEQLCTSHKQIMNKFRTSHEEVVNQLAKM